MNEQKKRVEAAIALARRLQNKLDMQDSTDRLIIFEAQSAAHKALIDYTMESVSVDSAGNYWYQYALKRNYCDYLQAELDKFDNNALSILVSAYNNAEHLNEKINIFATLPFPPPRELATAFKRAKEVLHKAMEAFFHVSMEHYVSFSAIEEMLYWELAIEPEPVDEQLQFRDDCESIINCIYPVMCSYWNKEWNQWWVFYDLGDNHIDYIACENIEDAWNFVIEHVGPDGDGFTKEGWRNIFARVSLDTFKRVWKQYKQDEVLMSVIFKKMS